MNDIDQPADAEPLGPGDRAVLAQVASLWWAPLLRGIMLVALGGYALLTPGVTLVAYTTVLAVFAVLDGVIAVVAGAVGWAESRWWAIARGVVGIVAGLFVMAHPALVGVIAVTLLVALLAVQAIIGGVAEIVAAIRERDAIEGEWWLVLGGVLSVLLGVILLARPVLAGAALIQVLGVFAVIAGVALIVAAFRLRRFGRGLNAT